MTRGGSRSLILKLSPEFILRRVVPTAAELAYGYDIGWLSASDVRTVGQAKRDRGLHLDEAEEAFLTADGDSTDEDMLIRALGAQCPAGEDPSKVWLYLGISALWASRADYADDLVQLDILLDDFEFPEETLDLVYYMPAGLGEPVGRSAIERRWQNYIERKGLEYSSRDQ
jgi:hypothetical protein